MWQSQIVKKLKSFLRFRWETDKNYCTNTVLKNPLYSEGPRLLDIIDTAVFDYLIGNADRHHYETLGVLDTSVMMILDNAKR
jgi:hypothetical protein